MNRDPESPGRFVPGCDARMYAPGVLILSGYGLGFFLAIQVGPVTLLIVRSVLRGGRALAVGLAMAAGVDLLYAIVGLTGIGRLLNVGTLRLWFGLVSAAILVVIGARTFWMGWRARFVLEPPDEGCHARASICDGPRGYGAQPVGDRPLALGVPAAAPACAESSTMDAAAVLLGVGLGTLTWHGGFSTLVGVIRRRIGDRAIKTIDLASGLGLIGFGGLLGYRTVHE